VSSVSEEPAPAAAGPLAGIRVLDLTRVLSGPFATMILADLGADVVKIEEPTHGDDTRHWGPPFVGDQAAYYLSVNRNKKSLALSLKTPRGKAVVRRLAAQADIVVENFRPGVAAALGIGYADLSADNPGLVYASISGYGQSGTESTKPGYDPIMQARSGLMSITGHPDGDPARVGVAIADISAGMYAVIGILAALQHRQSSGEGQWLDLSLFDAQVSWLTNVAGAWFADGTPGRRFGTGHPSIVPSEAFHTGDGLMMLAAGNDRMFVRLTAALGADHLADDPRFTTNRLRVQHRDELRIELEKILATDSTDSWVTRLNDGGIPAAPVNSVEAALQDPVVVERGMVVEQDHPVIGRVRSLGSPVKLSRTPPTMRSAPPLLGEHTVDVLSDLGFSADEIADMAAAGEIRPLTRDVR
jgi:crotonobetainyl-CoA:carnitine CoA-transferase CaiB-like acyl-CoA transferase